MRVFVSALLCALMLPAAASASVDGADFNRPFTTADVSDCVYPKARTGVAAFAFDGSYFPFALDAKTAWPGCEHAPGSIRVLKLQALTVGGRTTTCPAAAAASRTSTSRRATSSARSPCSRTAPATATAAARPAARFPIYARPTALPDDMKYKPGQPAGSGASWANYGDPGARFGSHSTYMLWNLPRRDAGGTETEVGGGGIIMATIKPRQKLLVCDVAHQRPGRVRAGLVHAQRRDRVGVRGHPERQRDPVRVGAGHRALRRRRVPGVRLDIVRGVDVFVRAFGDAADRDGLPVRRMLLEAGGFRVAADGSLTCPGPSSTGCRSPGARSPG